MQDQYHLDVSVAHIWTTFVCIGYPNTKAHKQDEEAFRYKVIRIKNRNSLACCYSTLSVAKHSVLINSGDTQTCTRHTYLWLQTCVITCTNLYQIIVYIESFHIWGTSRGQTKTITGFAKFTRVPQTKHNYKSIRLVMHMHIFIEFMLTVTKAVYLPSLHRKYTIFLQHQNTNKSTSMFCMVTSHETGLIIRH